MRRVHIIIAMLLASCSPGTKTIVSEYPLPSGDIVTVKARVTPGFLDPTIIRQYSVRWVRGGREQLPFLMHIYPDKSLVATETNGAVFLTTDHGAVARRGSKSKPTSAWHVWTIEPSDELFAYFAEYADRNGNDGVTYTTYACPLRTGPMTVHESAIETNRTIRFQNSDYFLSPTHHTGWWLPHRVESVDYNASLIIYRNSKPIRSMPERLVFTWSPDLKSLMFDPEKTKGLLQPAGGTYGSPAAGEPSAHP